MVSREIRSGFRVLTLLLLLPSLLATLHAGPGRLATALADEARAPYPEGSLIRLKGDTDVYVIESGRKCYLPDLETFQARGYRGDQVIEVDPSVFDEIMTGIPVPSAKTPFRYQSAPKDCVERFEIVSYLTHVDLGRITPGQRVVYTLRIKNTGTCPWENGYSLVLPEGLGTGVGELVSVPALAPGETADIRVTTVAPRVPGNYRAKWLLRNNLGQPLGNPAWTSVDIRR